MTDTAELQQDSLYNGQQSPNISDSPDTYRSNKQEDNTLLASRGAEPLMMSYKKTTSTTKLES